MPGTTQHRLYDNWFYAGATAAVFLIAILPVVWGAWTATLIAVFVQLPAYMLHQVEEYHNDRFRTFMNGQLGHGREVLTRGAVLVINIGGVWLVDLGALYLSHFARPGLGLIAMYLAVVNGVVHVVAWAIKRAYNPGLITAIFLLLPAGSAGLWVVAYTQQATLSDHLWGLGVAVAVHILIVIHLVRRTRAVGGARA